MSADSSSLRGRIQTAFKLHGFRLRIEASKWLESQLAPLEVNDEVDEWLDKILERLSVRQSTSHLNSAVIDKAALSEAIKVIN